MFELDYKKESDKIAQWIKKTVSSAGFTKVIVALSGGVDSAVSTALAALALGKENVYCVSLPYGQMSKEHADDAMIVANYLQIPQENIFTINIQPVVEEFQVNGDDVQKGNVMARVRMIYLYDLAKKLKVLVCGTENKTEHYLGYFTRFGDEASDIEPIRNFYKTQIWQFAKYLGIPEKIITKAPTAGLWETQTDEGEFGFSYKEGDKVLWHHFEEGLEKDEIIKKGITPNVVEKVLKRVRENEFKHRLPYEYK